MRTLISLKGASWRDRLLSAKLGPRAPVLVLDHFPTSCADLLPVRVETIVGKAAVGEGGGGSEKGGRRYLSGAVSAKKFVQSYLSPLELELARLQSSDDHKT